MTGYTCGWKDQNNNTYTSGQTITPTSNLTMTGYCTIKSNLSLKVSFNSTYVSQIKVCKTSGDCSGTNLVKTITTSGDTATGLTYNTAYYLYPTYTTGSKLSSWAKDSGAVGTLSSTTAANPTYTIGDGTNAVTHNGARQTYTVTLDKCGATNTPSSSTTATYYSTTLSSITVPTRAYTISFTNNVSGASASSTDTLTSTYTFNGWYTGSCASPSTKVATTAATPALLASVSGYTDSSARWTKTSGATLYASWTGQAKTLPTITKTGHTCKWHDATNNVDYNSGASMTPTANISLTATCSPNTYTITLDRNGGNTGSTSTTVTYGNTTLGSITTPTKPNTTNTRTVSGFTLTNSGANATVSSTSTLSATRP